MSPNRGPHEIRARVAPREPFSGRQRASRALSGWTESASWPFHRGARHTPRQFHCREIQEHCACPS